MTPAVASVRDFFATRGSEVLRSWPVILRLSVAPALAWWLSMQLFGHSQAFFAPIAAILTLTVGAGARASIVLEIIVGAALGILVGELLILSIGRGSWQLTMVVALAVVSARFFRLPGLAVTQAVISAVLLVAVVPAEGVADPALTRFVDALLGGAVGLAMIVLFPANPVRELDQGTQKVLDELAEILERTALALRVDDADKAAEALDRARETQSMVDAVGTLASSLAETARLSPFRWTQRSAVITRTQALADLDHALRNTRVLVRRAAAMLRKQETAPSGLADSLETLAELARNDPANTTALIAVSQLAIRTATEHLTINTAAIASQIRAIVADMLLASGTTAPELDELLELD